MAFIAAQIKPMPDMACIGTIKSIGPVAQSKSNPANWVLPIELKAQYSGKDAKFWFVFRPEFFEAGFDPNTIEDESAVKLYQMHIAHAKRPTTLKTLANSVEANGFEKLGAQFDALHDIDPRGIEQVLKEYLTGAEVGYVLKQRLDDDNSPTEQFEVDYLFVPDEEGLEAIAKAVTSTRRKRPLVLAFE